MAGEGLADSPDVSDITVEAGGVDRDHAAVHLAPCHESDGLVGAVEEVDDSPWPDCIPEARGEEGAVGAAGHVEVIHEKASIFQNWSHLFPME